MKQVLLKSLKKGDYFTNVPVEDAKESQVWIRGDYNKIDKNYECQKFEDLNRNHFWKGTKKVYIDFDF